MHFPSLFLFLNKYLMNIYCLPGAIIAWERAIIKQVCALVGKESGIVKNYNCGKYFKKLLRVLRVSESRFSSIQGGQ